MHWLSILMVTLIFSARVHAFEIPKGLSADDRDQIIRTIGSHSAIKTLSNPYPLGGYSGFEIGYSIEFVNVRELRRLGCTIGSPGCANTSLSEDSEWRFGRFTLGKGLYHDVDLFFSFIPPGGATSVSDFGGQLRWSFFQASFLPINMSLIAHGNQLNYAETFFNRNLGAEVLAGVNVDNFALYFGGGWVNSQGTFLSCASSGSADRCTVSPTDPAAALSVTKTVSQTVSTSHTVVGFSLHFANLFTAAQVDRYDDAVYSMKLGARF